MLRKVLALLFFVICSSSHAVPITYLLYGEATSYRVWDRLGGIEAAVDVDASIPLYGDDGRVRLNGNSFAVGSITIDTDQLSYYSYDMYTGGVSYVFTTLGLTPGKVANSHFWPLTTYSEGYFRLLDEDTGTSADNFSLHLEFAGTPFESEFLGGRFNFYIGQLFDDFYLANAQGSINGIVQVPVATVTEPSSIALLGIGLAGLAIVRRRLSRLER